LGARHRAPHRGIARRQGRGRERGRRERSHLHRLATGVLAERSDERPRFPVTATTDPDYHSNILAGLRVLVVDEEADTNQLLSALFTASGAEVHVAVSGTDGFDELIRWRPDVVVSDVGMPGEDGCSFIAKVRGLGGELRRVP